MARKRIPNRPQPVPRPDENKRKANVDKLDKLSRAALTRNELDRKGRASVPFASPFPLPETGAAEDTDIESFYPERFIVPLPDSPWVEKGDAVWLKGVSSNQITVISTGSTEGDTGMALGALGEWERKLNAREEAWSETFLGLRQERDRLEDVVHQKKEEIKQARDEYHAARTEYFSLMAEAAALARLVNTIVLALTVLITWYRYVMRILPRADADDQARDALIDLQTGARDFLSILSRAKIMHTNGESFAGDVEVAAASLDALDIDALESAPVLTERIVVNKRRDVLW